MPTIHAEPTPNPHSLKFTTTDGSFRDDGVAAFSSAAEAENHPLANRLFSIDGVEDVFITPTFVTVSKDSTVDWSAAQPEIKSVLSAYLDEQD
jgi:hypothetical protein